MVTWEFPHIETGALCRAVFDGGLLQVDVLEPSYDPEDWGDEDGDGDDVTDIIIGSTMRTCCADRDAAYRELRLHAYGDDLDRSESIY